LRDGTLIPKKFKKFFGIKDPSPNPEKLKKGEVYK